MAQIESKRNFLRQSHRNENKLKTIEKAVKFFSFKDIVSVEWFNILKEIAQSHDETFDSLLWSPK